MGLNQHACCVSKSNTACADSRPDTSLLSTIPTVTDTAYDLHLLNSYEVSVFFAPPNSKSDVNGELTFGGVDSTKFTGSINYVCVLNSTPESFKLRRVLV